jgi:hypothetical protein
MRLAVVGGAALALAITACYQPEIADCSVACGSGSSCPPQMTCDQGKCTRIGATCPADASSSQDTADAMGEHEMDADASVDADASHDTGASPDAPPVPDVPDAPPDRDFDASPDSPHDKTDGPDGADALPACPPRQYRNVVRNICVPAHDLNGDGMADLLAVNRTEHHALISGGTEFSFAKWLDGDFHGTGGACTADVTGDGYADGVSFRADQAAVVRGGNAGFGDPGKDRSIWSQVSLLGTRGTFLADVDGDERADVVSIFEADLVVARSTGSSFNAPVSWRTGDFLDWVAAFVADVDGNGMADLVALRPSSTEVLLSTGSGFLAAATWRPSKFFGSDGTFFADVDGDGRMDGVRLDSNGVWVMRAIADAFEEETRWYDGPLHGAAGTFVVDADGDGLADVVALGRAGVTVARSSGGGFSTPVTWYAGQFSSELNTTVAPSPAAPCAFADPMTVGVFWLGELWLLRSSNAPGDADQAFRHGGTRDMPVVGDWDGDGITTVGVYRPPSRYDEGGVWYLRNENTEGPWDIFAFAYGGMSDVPVVGDWDGDGVTTIGVYRPPHSFLNDGDIGIWLLRNTSDGGNPHIIMDYGGTGDVPVVGDWNGDGDSDIGLFRPSDSQWRLWSDADEFVFRYGDDPTDLPIVGDWDGDGTATAGIFRPANTPQNPTERNRWRLRNQNASGAPYIDFFYGGAGAIPVSGRWSIDAANAPAR